MNTNIKTLRCEAKTRDGTPCKARPNSGGAFCTFHDPQRAAAQAAGRQEGGRRRSQPRLALPAELPDLTVADVRDVCPLLSDTINRVRKGFLDPRIANTIGYLAGVLIRAFEVGDIAERIARLEATTRQHPPHNPHGPSAFDHVITPPQQKERSHVSQVQT